MLVLLLLLLAGQLPLGAPGLPETLTAEQVAPGLRYSCIQRGRVPADGVYTVQVACVAPSEVEGVLARVRALGMEGWTHPAGSLVSVRVGRMRLHAYALELAKSFPDAKVLYTGEEANADQGPWVVHVLEVGPEFRGRAVPALGLDRQPLTELARNALAGINGDYFVEREEDGTPGDPTGILLIDGDLLSEAIPGRSALVYDGQLRVSQPETKVEVVTSRGERRTVGGLNRRPGLLRDTSGHDTTKSVDDELVMYTPGRGLREFLQGGTRPKGWAYDVSFHWGDMLSGRGRDAEWLRAAFDFSGFVGWPDRNLDARVEVRDDHSELSTKDSWALGGGPQLLPELRAEEEGFARDPAFLYTFGNRRNPRTLAGVTADGRLLLVVVDGRQPEWSVGATFEESARLLQSLGAVQGLNLDGGGSSTMVVKGRVVNRPSEGAPRAIGDALLLLP